MAQDGAGAIAAAVRDGRMTALAVVEAALGRIAARDGRCNSFTRVLAEEARAAARAVDAAIAAGRDPGPLAGVPFAVKDLFDVAGRPTTAGAAFRAAFPPAARDAEAVARLRRAGAVLVGTLNMDQFAYGFATDNADYGLTRNPRDPERIAGGSSGGSAAAVAAGLVPLTLGSDTNGSIRVPAALCGVYGLRATHGSIPAAGTFPFAASLDQVGPFAASAADIRLAWNALRPDCPAGSGEPGELRVGLLGGWFSRNADPRLGPALRALAEALGPVRPIELPEVERARAAAFLITASEGGNLHLPQLRTRPMDYDPAVRDRLMAGALLPAATLVQAHRFRRWFRERAHAAMAGLDLWIAPACPGVAPRTDQPMIEVDGAHVSARANLGLYTQPLSLLGFPVLAAPLALPGLPLGAQIIAPPGGESLLFAVAEKLERRGLLKPSDIALNGQQKA